MRGDFLHLDPFVGESIHLTAYRVELAVGGHEPLPLTKRQGRQPARHELVRVLPEGDVGWSVAEQSRESGSHTIGLFRGALPLVIDVLRRVEPRSLLRLEPYVRPCLM